MTPGELQALIEAGPAPAGLILHVGAGLAPPFPDGPPEGAVLVLVEADPDRAAMLVRRHAGRPRVAVHAAALVPDAGPAVLQRLSPGAFSSLRRPTRLAEIYPGLAPPEPLEVPGLTAADLLAAAPPRSGATNWLILDAPGSEAELFAALAACPDFARFGRLLVRAARVPLYDGPLFEAAALGAAGLSLLDGHRDADPDWLWYLAGRTAPAATADPEALASLGRDLRVALRNQALAEADLRELRERYATVLEERTAQEALIGKLAQRLGEASDYLRRLGPPDEMPEEIPAEIRGGLAERLPGAEGRKSRKGRRKGKA